MRSIAFLAVTTLITLLGTSSAAHHHKVIELTDANFEHDTQATTGSTTGDWFVRFCTICKIDEETWGKLGDSLHRRVSVAYIKV